MRRRRPASYGVLRAWARAAIFVFYRRVNVEGREHVPDRRPVIFAANHSNALADVAVIVAKVPRFPNFLAASSWWKRRPARMLFNLGGVLPVRRAADGPGPPDNLQTFAACFDALADDAHLAIFPEGEMSLGPALLPLKTGAARIGLGAAQAGVEGVVIVPLGLVYEDRGRFRSDTTLRFGRPIAMDDWVERYAADAFTTVGAVTQELREELTRVTATRTACIERDEPATQRAVLELAVLTPAAAVGMIANAPALIAGAVARFVPDEMWRASVKGVGGTLLVPLTWATELALLSRRHGPRRASMLTVAGAVGGLATLAWLDRRRDLATSRARRADPRERRLAMTGAAGNDVQRGHGTQLRGGRV
jgi:1-acyl-sn-glycerol-3-phosphate acyltransferase